ncbi:MAG: glycoside hydrolase family 3 C-terminal domain-containing protein, partial [Rhizomicrobium sp.]
AWSKGLNVLLAGGINLARDPRGGRNFEYLGEDPLVAGMLCGAHIRGIQDQHVVSTIKHFALNDQETNRNFIDAVIDEAAFRESDLLAFEIGIEQGAPGAVMGSYNLINGAYGCGNAHLLNDVLKGDWAYPGWVMSDWGGVHSLDYAMNGLDQQSAAEFDSEPYFAGPLQQAVADGTFPRARLDNMVRRILRSMFAVGLTDHPAIKTTIDFTAHAQLAQETAESGIVLLKNPDALLPLSPGVKRIAVIGGYADFGVLSGGGSSQVVPDNSLHVPLGGNRLDGLPNKMVFHPSSPLAAIEALAPGAEVKFCDGRYSTEAEKLARWADVVVVFAIKWQNEGVDAPDLSLPDGQDGLITAVAKANAQTVVVLETGNPVTMPWLDHAAAVLQAWYPGIRGGQAIANVLFGVVNPSGRLPLTFPRGLDQLPRTEIPGDGSFRTIFGGDFDPAKSIKVPHTEGSDVGYRWFARTGATPLFPFGFGLSYSQFSYSNLTVSGGMTLCAHFDVTNTGTVAGKDVPQLYLTDAAGRTRLRLIGMTKLSLAPGETQRVTLTADPRLIADFDATANNWHIPAGSYSVSLNRSATDVVLTGEASLNEQRIKP